MAAFNDFCCCFRQVRQVRKQYEDRLMKANALYEELDECMKQLQQREEELKRFAILLFFILFQYLCLLCGYPIHKLIYERKSDNQPI